jgi:hypothetical protein
MRKVVCSLLAFALCFSSGGALVAQQKMVPGQMQRQSLSGGLIFRCLFDKASEAQARAGFPDDWTRKVGIDNGIPFPDHLNIGIVENTSLFSDYALRMNMEGGAAAVFSPKIPIRRGMCYTISVFAETNGLVFDEVSILAALYDNDNDVAKPIRTIESKRIRNTNGWQQLTIGPIAADMPNGKFLSVGLLVMPTTRQDYGAKVDFTNVEIRESPNISLEMANDHHLFFTPREIFVRCHFRGLDPKQHAVQFILEDHSGRIIGQREPELMVGNFPAQRFVVNPQNDQEVIHGIATWQNLPIQFPGFYRIRVATPESYIQTLRLPPDQTFDDPLAHIEPLTFVVMSQGSYQPGGEFGWNLDGWSPDEISKALSTLTQSGLSHLKLPVWISGDFTPQQRENLLYLCREFSNQRIRLIGLLSPVPKDMIAKIAPIQVNAASILGSDVTFWGNSVQPSLLALSLLIKDWQWTSDTDPSLIDLFFAPDGRMSPSGRNRFQAFHKLFDQEQFGFGIGMTWNWYQNVPDEQLPIPNLTLNFPIDSSITAEEAVSFLADTSSMPFRRSVSIAPLPADDYSLETRLTNFVQSLVLMKAAGMDTISLTAPKDEQIGVLRNDGTPNELYLSWRTTASFLAGSRFLGSITLPNRSRNYCFEQRGNQCLMVVWNDAATSENPVSETLYLGNELRVTNIWGRDIVPEQTGNYQTIQVTQTPVFVTGVNIDVARFRLSMQTGEKMISAIPNQPHVIPFSYRNDSASPMSIQITPEGPRAGDWTITPESQSANLEAGLAGTGTFDLTLLERGDTGRRLFQYDVKMSGNNAVEFAVYDEMMIGNPDVYMEFVSRLNEKGELEVIQIFVNNTENVYTYECRLTVPNRAPRKSRVIRQGFGRVESYVYTIERGQELLDRGVTEMFFRATASDGTQGEPMVYTIPLISE